MPSIKVIKRRIASVRTTKQVMKAMDMVAASKLQKTKARLDSTRMFFQSAQRIAAELESSDEALKSPFMRPRSVVKNSAFILITGDRGLCGSYNLNICEELLRFMDDGYNEKILAVGLKGYDFFRRRNKTLMQRLAGVSENATIEDAERIAALISAMYEKGDVDEVFVAYTRFESSLTHVPRIVKLLPIGESVRPAATGYGMGYDPDVKTFITNAIPMYVKAFVYSALVESSTCEQAARMVSMDAASNNATEIIDTLTRTHNRIRQSSITQEINEIISGANMLSD